MSTCQSCNAEVVFVPSAKSGKPMILDAKPENRIVLIDVVTGITYATSAGTPSETVRAQVVDTYVDHHATCPKAADWRNRTRSGAR